MSSALIQWLRHLTESWSPSIVGVFREDAAHNWPISANSAPELRQKLTEAGHLLPLPSESAALANVMEIELRQHLVEAASAADDIELREGTERSYPDLEIFGERFGDGPSAVDIKCARRKIPKSGATPTTLINRIALYTGNTYFLSIVVIYTFDSALPERITDVEVVVHETWRIASQARASATREYIGSVQRIEDLIAGDGEFESAAKFYEYWRHSARKWKKSPEAERLLRRALDDKSE